MLACNNNTQNKFIVNDSHLDYLYEEINVDGKDMAVIHIYSNYPDYQYIGDDDEGFACVDDAARAALYYLNEGILNGNDESIHKNKMLVNFLLYMQSGNGYFYNFIWEDYSINKDFETSVAEANWWTWRALWTLAVSYNFYKENDKEFAAEIFASVEKLIKVIKENIPQEYTYENISGIKISAWLPFKHAADQSSVLLLGLLEYYKQTNDEIILNYIKKLCEGIIQMQVKYPSNEYNGAFLSWMNQWHAWGNSQSYALLKCYKVLKDEKLLQTALAELNGFYAALITKGYLNSFTAAKEENITKITSKEQFSQIAYNIRPMVYAFMEAYKITGEERYAKMAGTAARWFAGDNPAGTEMYNPKTGIIFDGINSVNDVNKNSGAESTIEGLLSLLEISQNNIALTEFLNHK
jgi:hypothetical protein